MKTPPPPPVADAHADADTLTAPPDEPPRKKETLDQTDHLDDLRRGRDWPYRWQSY